MVLAASLYVLASTQLSPAGPIPIEDYRPAFIPQALREATCDHVFVGEGSVRGWREIGSHWTVKRPFLTVVRELRGDTQLEAAVAGYDEELLARRGLIKAFRKLPDRMIEISIRKGRIVTTEGPNFRSEDQRDHEEYVTASFTERPLYVGPKPGSWLPAATKAPSLPSTYPGVRIPDLSRAPDTWMRSMSATGYQQYWVTWYVAKPPAVAIPRILRQIERTGDWIVGPRTEGLGVHCAPKSRPSQLVSLSLSHYRVDPPDVPENVTPVTVSWSDPPR